MSLFLIEQRFYAFSVNKMAIAIVPGQEQINIFVYYT